MNTLQIRVQLGDRVIGRASSCIWHDDDGKLEPRVSLRGLEMIEQCPLKSGDEIVLEIYCHTSSNTEWSIVDLWIILRDDLTLKSCQELEITGDLEFGLQYQASTIHILNTMVGWDKGSEIKWSTSFSTDQKEGIITACAMWSGLAKSLPKAKEVIVDGSCITDSEDLYWELNTNLFGPRGFFALGLDSLSDAFCELEGPIPSDLEIKILRSDLISDAIGEPYLMEVVNDFKKHDISISMPRA
jgi:hypothetical protein